MVFTIKQARKYAGLTQGKVAESLGVSRGTYVKLEKNVSDITIEQLGKISEITGVPIGSFSLPVNFTNVEL